MAAYVIASGHHREHIPRVLCFNKQNLEPRQSSSSKIGCAHPILGNEHIFGAWNDA